MKSAVNKIDLLEQKLKIGQKKAEVLALQQESNQPGFWQDSLAASKKMKLMAELQTEIADYEKLKELSGKGGGEEFENLLKKLELKTFLSGKYDRGDALFSLHAGQGGTEAMDWAEMLKRMYLRYFEKQGWQVELTEETRGEEAGIKSCTLLVSGSYAYGLLKFEAGTHRLVRQSPFNADHLRQTSFALVEVLPLISEPDFLVSEEDLEWQFFRASSQGGQNVQKVSSAVRLKHQPSGIIVISQAERSQTQNRQIALQILHSRLWERQEQEKAKEIAKIKGEYRAASWGNQIRSYVLHPYHQIKDLRTGLEIKDTQSVLDGNLESLIETEIYKLS